MILEFEGCAIWWRGPAPFVFAPVPPEQSAQILAISKHVTYGWGVITAIVRIGGSEASTALFPRDGGYLAPVKAVVQRAEDVKVGDVVRVRLEIVARGDAC